MVQSAAAMSDPASAPKKEESELPRMTFGEHLEELRTRLFKSILVLLVAFVALLFETGPLIRVISRPHFRAMKLMGIPREQSAFLAGSYTEPVVATLKLTFIVALFVSSPFIAWQIWAFVAAGLYPKERRYVVAYAIPSFVLFLGGCAFGFFLLIPYGLWGMANMQAVDIVDPKFTFSEYLNLVMLLTIILGAIFELPLIMLFLTVVGLVQPATYSKWRRFSIVLIFIVAAVLTPPDVFSQLLMAFPLLILYEIGVILARIAARRHRKSVS